MGGTRNRHAGPWGPRQLPGARLGARAAVLRARAHARSRSAGRRPGLRAQCGLPRAARVRPSPHRGATRARLARLARGRCRGPGAMRARLCPERVGAAWLDRTGRGCHREDDRREGTRAAQGRTGPVRAGVAGREVVRQLRRALLHDGRPGTAREDCARLGTFRSASGTAPCRPIRASSHRAASYAEGCAIFVGAHPAFRACTTIVIAERWQR